MSGRLEHSPARIIQEYLILYGHGIDPNDWPEDGGDIPNGYWPIYNSREPDRPDDIVRVIGTLGRNFGYTQLDSERQEMHGIQVLVRSYDDGRAFLKAQDIAIGLDRIRRVELTLGGTEVGSGTGTGSGSGGVRYIIHSVARTSEVKFEGRDTPQGKRINYTMNALVTVRICF